MFIMKTLYEMVPIRQLDENQHIIRLFYSDCPSMVITNIALFCNLYH